MLINGHVTARRRSSQVNISRLIACAHGRAEPTSNDVTAVVIQDRGQIIPTPTDDLEVSEVGLPHLVDGRRFVFELIRSLDHHIIRCRD